MLDSAKSGSLTAAPPGPFQGCTRTLAGTTRTPVGALRPSPCVFAPALTVAVKLGLRCTDGGGLPGALSVSAASVPLPPKPLLPVIFCSWRSSDAAGSACRANDQHHQYRTLGRFCKRFCRTLAESSVVAAGGSRAGSSPSSNGFVSVNSEIRRPSPSMTLYEMRQRRPGALRYCARPGCTPTTTTNRLRAANELKSAPSEGRAESFAGEGCCGCGFTRPA